MEKELSQMKEKIKTEEFYETNKQGMVISWNILQNKMH